MDQRRLAASGTITDENYGRNNFNAGIIPAIYTAHSRFIEAGEYLEEYFYGFSSRSQENGSIVYTHAVYIPKVSPAQDLAKQFIKSKCFLSGFNNGDLIIMENYQ